MSAAFHDLIKQPEPRTLMALHAAKVVAFLLAVIAIGISVMTFALGFEPVVWVYVFCTLFVASVAIALVANRWSESLFARRAMSLGLDEPEARRFWRTYDWDEADIKS